MLFFTQRKTYDKIQPPISIQDLVRLVTNLLEIGFQTSPVNIPNILVDNQPNMPLNWAKIISF